MEEVIFELDNDTSIQEKDSESTPQTVEYFYTVNKRRCFSLFKRTYPVKVTVDCCMIPSFQRNMNITVQFSREILKFFRFLDYEIIEVIETGTIKQQSYSIYMNSVTLAANQSKKLPRKVISEQNESSKIFQIPLHKMNLKEHFSIELPTLSVAHEIHYYLSNSPKKFEQKMGSQKLNFIHKQTMAEK